MKLAAVAKKVMRAIDPNEDPGAEPISPLALVVLLVATAISVGMFMRWRIQPMQDVGHHVAMTAIVADYGRADSLYPAIYKPFDWLNANSLLYAVAGTLGKIIKPTLAFRLSVASYQALMPFATLFALRTFGRSAWGAVLAVPFAYNFSYVFGFVNFIFAGPLAVMALPLFYRMFVRPTKGRVAAATMCVTFLFLAHVHVFLWTGVLLLCMTLVAFLVTTKRVVLGMPTTKPWTVAALALGAVVPGLVLFFRWYLRGKQPVPDDELTMYLGTGALDYATIKSALKPPSQLLVDVNHYIDLHTGEEDSWFFAATGLCGAISLGIGRLHKWKRPPVLEIACVLTLVSYFFMPEHLPAQAMIGSRQIGFALWFAPAFFSPVPGRVTWLGRTLAIGIVIWLTSMRLDTWHKYLVKFQREEAIGFEDVMATAPPRGKIHYVNAAPDSAVFFGRSFWHVGQWYMLDKRGQDEENPAGGPMNSIRYRKSYELHRVTDHSNGWVSNMEIWQNFDIVLTRKWRPSAAELETANKHGHRLAKSHDWELWQSHEVKKK